MPRCLKGQGPVFLLFRPFHATESLLALRVPIYQCIAQSGGGMKFSNILFPVDFSDRSRIVAPLVNGVAKRARASSGLRCLVRLQPKCFMTPVARCGPPRIPKSPDTVRQRSGEAWFARSM